VNALITDASYFGAPEVHRKRAVEESKGGTFAKGGGEGQFCWISGKKEYAIRRRDIKFTVVELRNGEEEHAPLGREEGEVKS